MITIKINTDNAAFDDGNYEYEVARILRKLADRIEQGDQIIKLRDVNGNVTGKIEWHD